MSIDGYYEKQMVPKFLLQVSVRENFKSMASPPQEGLIKKTRDEENDIIISNSMLCNILPPKIKYMSAWYKVMCGCDYCISSKSMN